MDSDLKRIAYTFLSGWFVWMVKDILMGEREQTRKNTEALGALTTKLAVIETDLDAAHAAIRELKGTPRES